MSRPRYRIDGRGRSGSGSGCDTAVGPVAQWSEQATHNRSVGSSILPRPTCSEGVLLGAWGGRGSGLAKDWLWKILSASQDTAEGCRRLPAPLRDGPLRVDFRGGDSTERRSTTKLCSQMSPIRNPMDWFSSRSNLKKQKLHPVRVGGGRRGACQRICSGYRSRPEEGIMVG